MYTKQTIRRRENVVTTLYLHNVILAYLTINNQIFWLKDNHMTYNNLDIFASNRRQR